MACLEDIAAIVNILKTAYASMVQLLLKIVNDEPYSKSSRKEFKKFAGFPQNITTVQREKVTSKGNERAMTPTEEAAREQTLEHEIKDRERKRGKRTTA
ncbi:hypothetical protein TNCV_1689791 [Trichonephila clavipes]|nr:hypothetical protein TNCV_1689791 [Trichonephila clavipes]